jgi:hypothetical protein
LSRYGRNRAGASDTLIVDVRPQESSQQVIDAHLVPPARDRRPLMLAVDRLASLGQWHLWVTKTQWEMTDLYNLKPRVTFSNGYRCVPYSQEWGSGPDGGISALSYGEAFAMSLGDQLLDEPQFAALTRALLLPSGMDAALLFDPDVESFRGLFTSRVFDEALRLILGRSS